MAKKPKDQQTTETATTETTTPSTTTVATYDPTDILIDEQTIEDIDNQYKENAKVIEEGYKAQEEAIGKAYGAQKGGYDAFLGEVSKKQGELSAQDADAQRRANAYRYIAGIGDAISGVANLVGTAHGAANQQQTYNAPGVMAKAEEMRKERKLEMEQLNARLDELRAQKAALEGTRDLKLGELEGKKASEILGLELQKGRDLAAARTAGREEGWRQKQYDETVRQHEENKEFRDKQHEEGVRQFNETNARLKEQHAAEQQTRKEVAEANAKARIDAIIAKGKQDPKHQASVLQRNIVGVRDELAQKMGYKDYNEYLQYRNVSGWGEDIKGKRNKEAKKIRGERESAYPEVVDFLEMLEYPDNITNAQLSSLVGASKVFSDAIDKATVESADINPANDPNL